MKSWTETGSRTENITLVSYSKHQEPEFFMEAKRHLAERLMLVAMGAGEPLDSSCKQQVSRTLERILLSSPVHDQSMADFGCEPASGFLSRGSKISNMGSGPSASGTHGSIEGPDMELLLEVSSPKAGCKPENMDNDQLRENPSPVSVLDLLFPDSISSPTSPIESVRNSSPVELRIQPRRLSFEELLSQSSSPRETSLRSFSEDRGFISSYVNEVYQTAQSNWEDFLATDYPLESSGEHKVLYDFVKEVLVGLHSRTALFSSRVQPFSLEKDVINRVVDQVDWHNGRPMGPRTLDHLVRRDIAKHDPWLDTLSGRNDIVVEVADETLNELVIELIEAIHDICV
ncbi:hypothetical protein SSX86_009346 [Deinandra increscens subsp. villosa]|uniref:DUF4378 domain-containing protein n=1 Tax=Deinandra increscens subsp. villosa TaxID=3103831 RepID=A0AAP0DD38_9ASTR